MNNPELTRRIQERLVAPCCWNESVAVHRSELAASMRAGIERMVDSGLSEEQIVQHFITQHGQRVLMEPQGSRQLWLTSVPVASLAFGAVVLAHFLRKARIREMNEA